MAKKESEGDRSYGKKERKDRGREKLKERGGEKSGMKKGWGERCREIRSG